MRSKEVENTIERLKNGKNTAYFESNTAIYFIKDVETENKQVNANFIDTLNCLNRLSHLNDILPKDKIRKKIEELKNKEQDLLAKIEVLEELLGG